MIGGAIGLWFESPAMALNLVIAGQWLYGAVQTTRIDRDYQCDQSASERSIATMAGMTAEDVLHLPCDINSSTALQVAQQAIVKTRSGGMGNHQSLLAAHRSGMLLHVSRMRVLASVILPASGMAATVAGLQIAVMSIADSIGDGQDVTAVTSAILPVIGSLGVAFTTTLTAFLLGPLVLLPRVTELRSDITHYIAQLDAQLDCLSCLSHPFGGNDDE